MEKQHGKTTWKNNMEKQRGSSSVKGAGQITDDCQSWQIITVQEGAVL